MENIGEIYRQMNPDDLLKSINEGDRRSLARAITLVENEHPIGKSLINKSHLYPSRSQIIGITGPPGCGKSTLVNSLLSIFMQQQLQIAVLAVDPSSPFSGGAILGDRIRMLSKTNEKIYIRSLASRGRLGGLSPHTFDVISLLQLAGFDKIIIETVGAGQSEIDIMRNADTILVLTVPGLGDDIQILKAGIMEIADIFVVNKSDLPQSSLIKARIQSMLDLSPNVSTWVPKVVETSALEQTGITDLVNEMDNHYNYLLEEDRLLTRRSERVKYELYNKLFYSLMTSTKLSNQLLEKLTLQLLNREITLGALLEQMEDMLFSQNKN